MCNDVLKASLTIMSSAPCNICWVSLFSINTLSPILNSVVVGIVVLFSEAWNPVHPPLDKPIVRASEGSNNSVK